ncbi:MAG: response regulator, partial [Chloroflexota bacterium]
RKTHMSHTILIIEDSPDNMMIVSMILQSMGYNTIEATNGVMGLEMVKTHQPDVVLMDYHLPGINGLDATKTIKTSKNLCHIPVIALTADIYTKEDFLQAGCDAYLAKPIRKGSLLRTVQQVLNAVAVQS